MKNGGRWMQIFSPKKRENGFGGAQESHSYPNKKMVLLKTGGSFFVPKLVIGHHQEKITVDNVGIAV